MSRVLAILLVSWALWCLPTLCVSGALAHECACVAIVTEESDCEHGASGHGASGHGDAACDHDQACNHESDCGSDPCAGNMVRSQRINEDGPSFDAQPLAPGSLYDDAVSCAGVKASARLCACARDKIPLHNSDIPLLL